MAYDEKLAQRLRDLLADEPDIAQKRMFGGLAFLAGGRMAVGAGSDGALMLRCDPEDTALLIAQPHAGPFEMRGKAMRGWLRVDGLGVVTEQELGDWVWPAVGYARSLVTGA